MERTGDARDTDSRGTMKATFTLSIYFKPIKLN
jgi:hypothetical protein